MARSYATATVRGTSGSLGSIPPMRDSELNRWWSVGSAIAAALMHLLFRVKVEGIAHVPERGPAILAFNHVSVLDGPCLAIVTAREARRECRFLVAAEVHGRPVLGWILRRFEQIPIRRGEADAHALDAAIDAVGAGALIAIAPEGRVNADVATQLQRIRSGVARIAIPTHAPVIPVGIWGTQIRWPRSGLTFRRPLRPTLAVAYGEALTPPVDDEAEREEFLERLGTSIQEQVGRARQVTEPPC